MIEAPGIYTIPMADYLRDPAPAPSLSGGMAHTLLTRSPLHAWTEHPRLNQRWEPSELTAEQEEGTALHALILESEDLIVPVDAENWRTKAAQEQRAAIRATGKIPLLAERATLLGAVADEVRDQLRHHHDAADCLTAGKPEQTMIWRDGDVWVRNRVDWMDDDPRGWLTDLKTVATSAEPGAFGRKLVDSGYAVSAALYLMGARALGRKPAGYRWLVVERDPPHAISVVTMAPDLMDLAERQAMRALEIWRECMARDEWPAYPPRTAHIEAPAWALMRWEESEDRADHLRRAAKPRPFHEASDPRVANHAIPFA